MQLHENTEVRQRLLRSSYVDLRTVLPADGHQGPQSKVTGTRAHGQTHLVAKSKRNDLPWKPYRWQGDTDQNAARRLAFDAQWEASQRLEEWRRAHA